MKLFFYGSDSLNQSDFQPVICPGEEEVRFLRDIEAHMLAVINEFGISGLAAPQIGFPIQMVVVRIGNGKRMTLLNPVIERMYGVETEYPEGCISCPPGGNHCGVARMQHIHVSGSVIEAPAVVREFQFTSRDARVVQHEVDHLRGTFFFDRANLVEKAKVLERFYQWKRTYKQSGLGLPFGGGRNAKPKRHRQLVHVPSTNA